MATTEFAKLTGDLEKAQAQAKLYAQETQRLGRERVELLNLLSGLDETRAKLAVARATMADLRAKLAELQAKYDAMVKQVAA